MDDKPDFYFLKEPQLNKKVKLNRKLELLWRPELAILLQRLWMPEYKALSKPAVRKKIMEWTKTPPTKAEITRIKRAAKEAGVEPVIPESKVNPADVSHEISELLFERDYEKLLAEIAEYRKANNPRKRGPKKRTSIKRTRRAGK